MTTKHTPSTPLPLDWWPTYTHAEQWLFSKGFERLTGWQWRSKDWLVFLRRDTSGVRGRACLRSLGEE